MSCMATEQLICAFDFAYAKTRFSYDTAQICYILGRENIKTSVREVTNIVKGSYYCSLVGRNLNLVFEIHILTMNIYAKIFKDF